MAHPTIKYLFFISIIVTASCNKLNEVIRDKPSGSTYITSAADVTSALDGTYGMFESANLFKAEASSFLTLAADDIVGATANYNLYSQKLYDPTTAQISWIYTQFYGIINNCNFLLKKIQELNLDATYRIRAEGEIKFMRAVSYFYLVRMYGGVPIRTEPTDANTDFFIGRSSVDQVDSLIFSDLQTANMNLLPKSQSDGIGLTNKGAAQAMLAKAYLTYGNYLDLNGRSSAAAYASARDYSDSVILSGQYSLMNNYADLWNVNNEANAYNTEVIWGIRFTRDNVQQAIKSVGSEFALRYMPVNMGNVTGNIAAGRSGSANFKPDPWFYDICTTGDYVGDYRAEVSFLTSFTNYKNGKLTVTYPLKPAAGQPSENQPYLYKYMDGAGIDSRNHENDLFIIRLSEVYLIKAEAINEIDGPTTDAYDAFNKLRARARSANGTARTTPADLTPGLTKEDFRMKIFNERGLELVGECQRWFDLVRMRSPAGTTMYEYQFGTYLPTITKTLPVWNAGTQTWTGGRSLPGAIIPYNTKFLLFPIPVTETSINPLMEQNPGYN